MEFSRHILTESEAKMMTPLALAHLGDAVFELLVRTRIAISGKGKVGDRHRDTVKSVSASSQAEMLTYIEPHLTESELGIFRRGRNARSRPAPKSAGSAAYHASTGLEALFGYLYIIGKTDRACELFEMMVNIQNMRKLAESEEIMERKGTVS